MDTHGEAILNAIIRTNKLLSDQLKILRAIDARGESEATNLPDLKGLLEGFMP